MKQVFSGCYSKLFRLYKEHVENGKMLAEVTVPLVHYFYLLSC